MLKMLQYLGIIHRKKALFKILALSFILFTMFTVVALAENIYQAGDTHSYQNQDLYKYLDPDDRRSLSGGSNQRNDSFNNRGLLSNSSKNQALKAYKVPFDAYEGTSRRIIIQVTLNRSFTVPMALDTGAPGMIISSDVATKLGIIKKDDVKLMTWATGLGGRTPAIFTIIDNVQIGGAEDNFVPTRIIRQSISPVFKGLIGMDFLARYDVNIDTRVNVVIFKELPHNPNMRGGHDERWWRYNFINFATMRSNLKKIKEALENKKDYSASFASYKEFIDRQYREANKLFNKLDSYASRNSVPMHWRKY